MEGGLNVWINLKLTTRLIPYSRVCLLYLLYNSKSPNFSHFRKLSRTVNPKAPSTIVHWIAVMVRRNVSSWFHVPQTITGFCWLWIRKSTSAIRSTVCVPDRTLDASTFSIHSNRYMTIVSLWSDVHRSNAISRTVFHVDYSSYVMPSISSWTMFQNRGQMWWALWPAEDEICTLRIIACIDCAACTEYR